MANAKNAPAKRSAAKRTSAKASSRRSTPTADLTKAELDPGTDPALTAPLGEILQKKALVEEGRQARHGDVPHPVSAKDLGANAKADQEVLDAQRESEKLHAEADQVRETARIKADNDRQIREGNSNDAPNAGSDVGMPAGKVGDGKAAASGNMTGPRRAKISTHAAAEKAGWTKVVDDEHDPKSGRERADARGVTYERMVDHAAQRVSGLDEKAALAEVEDFEARRDIREGAGETSFRRG